MKKMLKRAGAMLLSASMLMSMMSVSAFAQEAPGTKIDSLLPLEDLASKTIELTNRDENKYEITLSVPGAESEKYSEIIFMFDNSASHSGNFAKIKEAIAQVGRAVLNDTGNMKLTVMSFGYRGVTALEKVSTPAELEAAMDSFTSSDMSDGIGATNCEAGIVYVQDYIKNSPNLDKSYVFYISDGESNVSEEEMVWDDWENNHLMRTRKTGTEFVWSGEPNNSDIIPSPAENRYTASELIARAMNREVNNFVDGGQLAPATITYFGDAFAKYGEDIDAAEAAKDAADETLAAVNADIAAAIADQAAVITAAQALKDAAAKTLAEKEAVFSDVKAAASALTAAESAKTTADAALALLTEGDDGYSEAFQAAADAEAAALAAEAAVAALPAFETAEADVNTASDNKTSVDAEQNPIISAAEAAIADIKAADPDGAEGPQGSLNDRLTAAEDAVESAAAALAAAEAAAVDREAIKAAMGALLSEKVYDEDGVSCKKTTEDGMEVDLTLGRAWMDLVWEQAYEMAGLTIGEPCKASEFGTAVVLYDCSANGAWISTMLSDMHYNGYKPYFEDIHTDYSLNLIGKYHHVGAHKPYEESGTVYLKYEKGQRAAREAIELSEMDKVETLYLIGMGSSYGGSMYYSWMNGSEANKNQTCYDGREGTALVYAEGPKIEFQVGGDVTGICDTLKVYAERFAKTPYNDVSITDLMSRWVTLDPESVRFWSKGEVITEFDHLDAETGIYYYKFLDGKATTELVPVTVTPVENLYNVGDNYKGESIEDQGNGQATNVDGQQYEITWNIKDGALLASDNFKLTYSVVVNTTEENFAYNTTYPANGQTQVHYVDDEDQPQSGEIDVPTVDVPKVIKPHTPSSPRTETYDIIVNYIDKETGEEIAARYQDLDLPEGSAYDVTDKDAIAIEGYTYDSTTGDALSGTMDSNKEIIVYYVKDQDEPVIEIPDEEPPLADLPDEEPPLVDLPDELPPLDATPKTGVSVNVALAAAPGLSALLGAACLTLSAGKKPEEE